MAEGSGSRALPDLVSRIRVDSSGVDQAVGSLISSFGKADLALAGAGAALGLIAVGIKSIIDIAEKHEESMNGLEQAYQQAGLKLSNYKGQIDEFIDSNKRYITDQSEVLDGYAKLTRAGLDQTEVQRVMNDALDLSSLKHISLSDAVDVLNAAEHGRMRGLIDLGITNAKYTDANGNLILSQHSVAHAMDEVDKKVAHGRDTQTEMQQSTHELNNDWQDLANKAGPPLVGALTDIVGMTDLVITAWSKVPAVLTLAWDDFAIGVERAILAYDAFAKNVPGLQQITPPDLTVGLGGSYSVGGRTRGPQGLAGGGLALPGEVYTVGENGPETLVMGDRSGMVYPNSSGSAVGGSSYSHISIDIPVILDGEVISRIVDHRVVKHLST